MVAQYAANKKSRGKVKRKSILNRKFLTMRSNALSL